MLGDVHACMCSVVSVSATPRTTRLLCPWDYPGKSTRLGCHFLVQRCWEAGALKLGFEDGGGAPLTRVPQTWDMHHGENR